MVTYHFYYPYFLLLTLPVLFLFWFVFYKKTKKQRASLKWPSTIELSKLPKNLRVYMSSLPRWLYLTSIMLLIMALARPQQNEEKTSKNIDGVDIMLALDVSDSMLIEDMKPTNRIEAAKATLIRFVEGRSTDRIGVVIFAGEAFTLIPLTLDYDLIKQRVSEITTARKARIKDGTALGVALASSSGRLKDSTAKTRIVIFLTDGENNSGTIDPETGLEIAKGFGLKIYSIALGKSGPTRIPVYTTDIFGNKVKTYQPFVSTVNEELLSKMADQTGGKFFQAEGENSLNQVFDEIDKLEKTKITVNKYVKVKELFIEFLKWALVFWLMAYALQKTWLRRLP